MYITKEELDKRLNKTNVQIVERERKKRNGININDVPEKRLTDEDRTIIGILSEIDTQKNVAGFLGVSAQTVSNSSRGLTSPTIGLDKDLRDAVKEGKDKIGAERLEANKRIEEQLVSNLAAALGHVANNLSSTDAAEASKIATDMSKILDRVTVGKNERGGNRTAIIINVPSMKDEKSYQTITV